MHKLIATALITFLAWAVSGCASAEVLGMHSPGISYADIAVAKVKGMGSVYVTPTQTVDHAIAEKTVHFYLNNNIASLVNMMAGIPPNQ